MALTPRDDLKKQFSCWMGRTDQPALIRAQGAACILMHGLEGEAMWHWSHLCLPKETLLKWAERWEP